MNILIMIVILIIMVSCSSPIDPQVTKLGKLTGQTCELPCWYNLHPNSTTYDEFADEQTFVTNTSTLNPEIYTTKTSTVFMWWDNESNHYVLEFEEKILKSIDVTLSEEYTLGSIVEVFGTPNWVEIHYSIGTDSIVQVVKSLIYRELGLIVRFEIYTGKYKERYYFDSSTTGQNYSIFQSTQSNEEFLSISHDINISIGSSILVTYRTLGWMDFKSISGYITITMEDIRSRLPVYIHYY